ncbi:COA8 family protein-like protein [Argiope bruennichi]|uniref:COA8 family protein-like protein n=1 Tax=Argiope bruennichi TaxID=94029 RepID=A0A8T0EA09_ARGBR|nr:COA8 family protein-like protein [Argiope bruennichi]
MHFLRDCLFRHTTYFLKQNKFLYYLSQNQNRVEFHLCVSLLQTNKQDIPPEIKPASDDGVWIGPPHPVSQLRLKVFPESTDLTKEEREFYSQCKKTQAWNHEYWEAHNNDFHKSEEHKSDDMSLFYEHFLKRNYSKHIAYNWNWYKKNFELLYLSAKVNFSKLKKIFTG